MVMCFKSYYKFLFISKAIKNNYKTKIKFKKLVILKFHINNKEIKFFNE